MEPSKYQKQLLEWVRTGKGNGCCNAAAGAGKTTSLYLVAKELQHMGYKPYQVKVIVFGKANAQDLIKKFGPEWERSISTLHSTGYGFLRKDGFKGKIDERKYWNIAKSLGLISDYKSGVVGSLVRSRAVDEDSEEQFLKLIDLCRLTDTSVEPEGIIHLINHFSIEGINDIQEVATGVATSLAVGEEKAKGEKAVIDFTDQIWLPVKWELHTRSWWWKYRFVLIDEAMDLNAIQRKLALSLAGTWGRILAVSDPRQAIMAFAGSDHNSHYTLIEETKATELPLSVCYRCPSSHIELVKGVFPSIAIETAPNAIEGSVTNILPMAGEKDKNAFTLRVLLESSREGDLILCRTTAPLINSCIGLIAKGKAAAVKGRDIGATLIKELQAITKMKGFQMKDFFDFLEEYKSKKMARLSNRSDGGSASQLLEDKLSCLEAIYTEQPTISSAEEFSKYIQSLFTDQTTPLTLSTVHRAKGLEANRVFIIHPTKLPLVWEKQQAWQLQQENNLLYVALTRAKQQLTVVGTASWL